MWKAYEITHAYSWKSLRTLAETWAPASKERVLTVVAFAPCRAMMRTRDRDSPRSAADVVEARRACKPAHLPRIETIRNGRVEPLMPRPPLRSSAVRSNWHGIILEEHHAGTEYVRPDVKNCSTLLHVFTGVPVRQEWRVDGHTLRFHSPQGSILIVPSGFEGSVRCWRSRPETQWMLEFDRTTMEQRVWDCLGGARLELVPHFDLTDMQMLRLLQALHADVVSGSPCGSLFGETVGAALAMHLAQHYSTKSAPTGQSVGNGLGAGSLQHVLEYIHANLTSDLHLKELADVADLSTFHFAKLFKRSTGCSPHQYILQRRIERAQELLRNPHISLSEVSLRAGFADQSHLSNTFRRCVGLTPSRFRALRWGFRVTDSKEALKN